MYVFLLLLCWVNKCFQFNSIQFSTFGAFSLAPLILALVGKCVGVQGYKGSLFLSSITQPYHLLVDSHLI